MKYLLILLLLLCGGCSKSSKAADDSETVSDSVGSTDSVSDVVDSETQSAPVSTDPLSTETTDPDSSSADSASTDSERDTTSEITYFDTDPSSECVHPVVTAKCSNGWCEIPAGCFVYGSPTDQPCNGANDETQVHVTLTRGFLMQQNEVTQHEWETAGFDNPVPSGAFPDNAGPNKPVVYVNWYEAMAYANALSAKEGFMECYDLSGCTGTVGTARENAREYCTVKQWDQVYNCPYDPHVYDDWYVCPGYRLPTAAEWEYAARAGTANATYNGDFEVCLDFSSYSVVEPMLEPIAWYNTVEGEHDLNNVGQKLPNRWGLHDILGNADEWIDYIYTGWSLAQNEGQDGPLVDPMGTKEETSFRRSRRGGKVSSIACRCAVTSNGEYRSSDRTLDGGFRLVRNLPSTSK